MKSIHMMSKTEILISDEEMEKIRILVSSGKTGLIGLKNGDIINLNSIETISDAETEAYFMGNRMNRDLTRVLVGGEWKTFGGRQSEIEYRLKNKQIIDIDMEGRLNEVDQKRIEQITV